MMRRLVDRPEEVTGKPETVYEKVVGWVEPRSVAARPTANAQALRWASRRYAALGAPYILFSYTL